MPGAANVVEFKDSTIQENVWEKRADGTIENDSVTYTMYWNFGQTSDEKYIDKTVEYKDRKHIVKADDYLYGPKYPILTVINSYGCEAKYTEEIFIDIKKGIYFPNAFSPTNPAAGVRTFQPVGYSLDKCDIWVYDVWGNLVWYSNDVKDGIFVGKWDGTYNGEMLKSDTYIWKCEVKFMDGTDWKGNVKSNGTETKFGSVVLIR